MSQLLVSTAQLIDRGVGSFCRVVLITTGLFMLAVLTIIVMQRYTNIGTFDSGSELCSLAFPIFVMAGIVDAARKGAHVATQILLNALGATGRIFLVIVLHGITAIAYFYLAWYAWQNALIAHDELSTVLQVPGSLGYGCLTAGLFLVGLCSLGAIVRHTLGREPVHVNLADAGPGVV